nr:hypothetical protein [Clostridium botulinum]
MRVIFNEIKKIFNPKMVFLLIIINLIMYFLYIEFDIKHFPNGRPEGDIYKICVEMHEKYGEYMDENEFQDFVKNTYNKKLKEINKYIQNHTQFKKYGVKNYNEYIKKFERTYGKYDKRSKEFQNIHDKMVFHDWIELFWEFPQIEDYIEYYKNKDKIMLKRVIDNNNKQETKIKEILSRGDETSIFPYMVFDNYNRLILYGSETILLGIVFMIVPIYLSDKKNKVNYLQYTCKNGRKTFKKKIVAGIISSFIITTVELIILFILYSFNNTSMFFNCSINSFSNYSTSWYNITFIQYIVITIVAVYILVLALTLISMLISSMVGNYIALIGLELPIIFITIKFFLNILVNYIGNIIYAKWVLTLAYLCIFLIPIILIVIVWKKKKF